MEENTTLEGMEENGFLEGWEDEQAETAQEAEAQPEPAAAPEPEGPETAGEDAPGPSSEEVPDLPPEQPKTWTLNHQGQDLSIGENDLLSLAQRGLDSEQIRMDYDTARPVFEFFNGLAGQAGMTVQDYIGHIRAQMKQADGMSVEEARRAIELEDREAIITQKEEAERRMQEAAQRTQAEQQRIDERRRADCEEFLQVFPGAAQDPQSIPPEVWADVRKGFSLVGAYSKYAAERAQVQAQALQQNQANAQRSAGSMRSAGGNVGPKDPFLEGFLE